MTTPQSRPAIVLACQQQPNLSKFFAEEVQDQLAAAQLCQDCPLLVSCRALGLQTRPGRRSRPRLVHEYGVWGGLTAEQRRWISRGRRGRRPQGSAAA